MVRKKPKHKGFIKKPLESMREHIGKMIDNSQIDPLKTIAFASTSLILYQALELYLDTIQEKPFTFTVAPMAGLAGMAVSWFIPQPTLEEMGVKAEVPFAMKVALSLSGGYLIVEHGAEMVASLKDFAKLAVMA